MSRPISYFSNYHGKENCATNYCGLILKMIYSINPVGFEEIVSNIVLESGKTIEIGPRFFQQVKRKGSVPDLCICQRSFEIFFETKLSDWFHEDQLKSHISGFDQTSQLKILVLLCKEFDSSTKSMEQALRKDISETQQNIHIVNLTFEDFIELIEPYCHTEYLSTQFEEFRDFLDRENLLQTWKYRLDVVNCAGSIQEIEQDNIYICPDQERNYTHKRSRYFGAYKDKCVNLIYQIDAVVSVSQDCDKSEIKWMCNAINDENEAKSRRPEFCKKAKQFVSKYRSEENTHKSHQVFFLTDKQECKFKKESKGGMFGSKMYFDLPKKVCDTTQTVAEFISKYTWETFKK